MAEMKPAACVMIYRKCVHFGSIFRLFVRFLIERWKIFD